MVRWAQTHSGTTHIALIIGYSVLPGTGRRGTESSAAHLPQVERTGTAWIVHVRGREWSSTAGQSAPRKSSRRQDSSRGEGEHGASATRGSRSHGNRDGQGEPSPSVVHLTLRRRIAHSPIPGGPPQAPSGRRQSGPTRQHATTQQGPARFGGNVSDTAQDRRAIAGRAMVPDAASRDPPPPTRCLCRLSISIRASWAASVRQASRRSSRHDLSPAGRIVVAEILPPSVDHSPRPSKAHDQATARAPHEAFDNSVRVSSTANRHSFELDDQSSK